MADWTHCPYCGTKLDPTDTACRHCGAATPSATTVRSGEIPGEATEAELEQLTAELKAALAPGLQMLRPLGQGGMGVVFLARDPALKRLVVVKVLSPALAHDEHARKRFEREAEAAAAVSHPNVVAVYQVGRLPQLGTSYFLMQYVEGQTLAERAAVHVGIRLDRRSGGGARPLSSGSSLGRPRRLCSLAFVCSGLATLVEPGGPVTPARPPIAA